MGGVVQVVIVMDYMGYVYVVIVNYNGQYIGWGIVRLQDNYVVQLVVVDGYVILDFVLNDGDVFVWGFDMDYKWQVRVVSWVCIVLW